MSISKKNKCIIILLLMIIEIAALFLMYKSFSNKKIYRLNDFGINSKNTFAILLEQTDGSYIEAKANKWPSNYLFNNEKSICMDSSGNTMKDVLAFDYRYNRALITTKKSTFCYLYFDIQHPAYAIYSADDYSLTFVRSETPIIVGSLYNEKEVTEVYTGFENSSYEYNHYTVKENNNSIHMVDSNLPWDEHKTNIKSIVFADEIIPVNTDFWFSEFTSVESIDLALLNTSKVTTMTGMFFKSGTNTETFLLDLSKFVVDNVKEMYLMFYHTAYNANNFKLVGLENWNVSNVTNMSCMFESAGHNATTWSIGGLSNWDVSNVVYMADLFHGAGYLAKDWDIGDLSNWNTGKVENMQSMFNQTGYNDNNYELKGISEWDVSSVKTMSHMFYKAGYNTKTFELDLSKWTTGNLENFGSMFSQAAFNAQNLNINLSNWDLSNAVYMAAMFTHLAYSANAFNLNLSNWDTRNVTNMTSMFYSAGYKANYLLDLTNWNVSNVIEYSNFNTAVNTKVLSPNFK